MRKPMATLATVMALSMAAVVVLAVVAAASVAAAYGQSRDVAAEFPGAQGFGVIRRVAAADEARFVANARRDGRSDFAVRQFQPHSGDRYVIHFVEPIGTNQAAVGRAQWFARGRRRSSEQ